VQYSPSPFSSIVRYFRVPFPDTCPAQPSD
jgi:hypothetical protein